jgi:ABC-type multidrug transport system fused ATPase/permease subunit
LIVIEQNPGQNVVSEGLPYAIILSIAACLSALAQNRTTFLSTKSGIILRAALIRAIYKHSLRLSPAGRAGLTTGEVTNLVAVDTQKLYDVMLEFHNLWSCPILIVVVSVLLSVIVGPTLMVGVVVLILMLPLVQTLVSRMLRIRKERSKLTDARINLLTAMLQGIRVTKLNFYEGKVEEHVSGVRDQEMRLLRKELRMWGLVLSVAVVSPLIAFGVAVSFYVLVDEDNILTPSKSFTALLLFSILRFPVNMTARLVGKAAQALEANRRISNFLDRELRSSEPGHQSSQNGLSPGEGVVVDIQNRSFAIKPDFMGLEREASSPCIVHEASNHATVAETVQALPQTFTIRNISLQLRKGQVVAVVGKVGSGKTLLLRALLGEIPSASGTELSLDGRISYAAQLPFILNATVRDNILFGSEFDEGRYEKALDACCLRPDLKRLGEAEDLTEIGERGVTLSGGKQRGEISPLYSLLCWNFV